MATKKYKFTLERILRKQVELDIDIEELRNQPQFQYLTDDEILCNKCIEVGSFHSNYDWNEDEHNIRTIFDVIDNTTIYEN